MPFLVNPKNARRARTVKGFLVTLAIRNSDSAAKIGGQSKTRRHPQTTSALAAGGARGVRGEVREGAREGAREEAREEAREGVREGAREGA